MVAALSHLEFVRSSLGGVSRPSRTYLRNQTNSSCLGEQASFAAGERLTLYKRLGCLEKPRSEDILAHIADLRERRERPANPDSLYGNLVEALKSERKPLDSHCDDEMLWVGDSFCAPSMVLIGSRYRKLFLNALPLVYGGNASFRKSAQALGAHTHPQSQHWLRLLRWYADKYQNSRGPVPPNERVSLRELYGGLSSLPLGAPKEGRVLLDQSGLLHSQMEAENGTYLIDDDPRLSERVVNQGLPISFADNARGGNLPFFTAVGARRLTEVRKRVGTRYGEETEVPRKGNADILLLKLHEDHFASAVSRLAEYSLATELQDQDGNSAGAVKAT